MYPNSSSYQSNQFQSSDSSSSQRPTSASQSTFSNGGAFNQQQGGTLQGGGGDRSNHAAMYAQQQNGLRAGGGGQWAHNGGGGGQSFAQQAQYAGNGSLQQQQQQYGQGPSATANLFQQQLAQQSSMAPSQNSLAQPPHAGNSYQSSAQAYMQTQQQLAQARGATQGSPHPSSFPTSSQSPASNFSQIPNQTTTQSQQSPSHDPSNQSAQSNSMQSMSGPQLMEILRGVSLQGMTPQIYNTLTPMQQQAVQEIMIRTRSRQAQQQSQLGLGLPGSPAAPLKPSPSSTQPPPNVSPAPSSTTLNRPNATQPPTQQATPSQLGFLKTLSDFYAKRGITFNGPPVIEGRQIDLPRFYAAVSATGGFANTNARRLWGTVASTMQFPAASVDDHPEQRLQQIASAYHGALYAFEQTIQQMQYQRLQAARAAAAAGQAPSTPVANGVPVPFTNPQSNAPTPSAQSTSHTSPAPQAIPQPVANSPITTQPSRPASSGSTTASNLQNPSMQKEANIDSKVPPPFETRPGSAASRKESVVVVEDVKGKGKAVEMPDTSIKVEDFVTSGTATPKNPILDLPDSNVSASPRPITADSSKTKPTISQPPPPPPPVEPPRRKRQKIEYVPYNKTLDTVAGYDLGGVEEVFQQTARRKRPRTAYDLGLVDLHSLTMSIRSRLASEVSFALNSLTLISMSIRTHPQETNSIPFPLRRCQNLYDELVDLLEETAFGYEDEDDEEEERSAHDDGRPPASETYSELFQTITEEAGRLRPPDPDERNRNAQLADLGQTPLRPIDTILSVTNILRNFSIADDNATFLGKDPHLLDVLARLTKLPLETSASRGGGPKRPLWPIRISPLDSMTLKKDVLELLVNFGLDVRLDQQNVETSQSIFDLLTFFLLDAHRHSHTHFDLSQTPGNSSRIAQSTSIRIAHYVDLGLAAFSRVTLFDSNRIAISRLASHSTLDRLFDSLIRLVPISESDFQLMTLEAGLVFVENLVMSLYNLVYLATPELKLELRSKPAYIRSLMRVVRRLSGSHSADSAAAAFQPLIERCIATLQLLSSLGGVTVGSTGIESTEVPWWGMSMSGYEEDEVGEGGKQMIRPAQPTEADRGIVKQRLPPSASTAAGLDPGLPILSGETKSLFESLAAGSVSSVFGSLVTLL